jgi:hypothetical protein
MSSAVDPFNVPIAARRSCVHLSCFPALISVCYCRPEHACSCLLLAAAMIPYFLVGLLGRIRSRIRGMGGRNGYLSRGNNTLSEMLPLIVRTTGFGFYCSSFNGSFKVEACESVRLIVQVSTRKPFSKLVGIGVRDLADPKRIC